MATTSDQIQADIARTRARMSTRLDTIGAGEQGGATNLTTSISEQIRERPLLAIGLSLLAGSLLKDYLGGSQASSGRSTARGMPDGGRYGYATGSYSPQQPAGSPVRQGISNATDKVGDAAQQAVDTTKDAARQVVDSATGVAQQVAETTGDVANQVWETTSDAAEQVWESTSDAGEYVSDSLGNLTASISEQVRQRPLVAVGVSLLAGALLKDYLGGSQTSSGRSPARSMQGRARYGYTTSSAYSPQQRVGSSVSRAADKVGDAAQQMADTTKGAARQVVDTAQDAAGAVAETTTDVARQVADTTGEVVHQVRETTGDAASQVADSAGDFYANLGRQVQQRPLTALGVAIAAGMLLQPTLKPHISAITQDFGSPVGTLGSGFAEVVSLPEPDEMDRIRETLVPATVEKATQFTDREMRDYLDQRLEGVVGQTSLRAGVVAAATEKAEELVTNRLPTVLERNLHGTRGLLLLALAGAFLNARNQARQGQGQTLSNIKTDLAQSITQTSKDQLLKFFPEFREQYQASEA